MTYKSEIRDSTIVQLLEKTRKKNYKKYLLSIRLEKIRLFKGERITFDFPVTALIGPNGCGKSTIIGTALLAYQTNKSANFFRKSRFGDEGMNNWIMEYEVIDKDVNNSGTERFDLNYKNDVWTISKKMDREVKFLSITRTVPISESPTFMFRKRIAVSNKKGPDDVSLKKIDEIGEIKRQAERILGKSLSFFSMYEFSFPKKKTYKFERVATGNTIMRNGEEVPEYKKIKVEELQREMNKQYLYVGSDGTDTYSEFNFGAGETSIIRMVAELENAMDHSLVLIEEIENGLHPIAVKRVVEYFIEIAKKKNLQIIFTTHSDYALEPLPPEAIWASVEGKLQQGKLSIETLRAISGRFDKKLAVFVEDDFAKTWIEYVIREKLLGHFEEIGVYSVGGDGNAVKVHEGHTLNPSIQFDSICFIDGDSRQTEDASKNIFRLPGEVPEIAVFDKVLQNIGNNIALLTVACQKPIDQQDGVLKTIQEISRTNRDPHLIFSQIGLKLGFISAEIIRGAFMSIWAQENQKEVDEIIAPIKKILSIL